MTLMISDLKKKKKKEKCVLLFTMIHYINQPEGI